MSTPSRVPLTEAIELAFAVGTDAEVLADAIRSDAESGTQIFAAEVLAERARALVEAAVRISRAAARRRGYAGGPPLPRQAAAELRSRARERVATDVRTSRARRRGK